MTDVRRLAGIFGLFALISSGCGSSASSGSGTFPNFYSLTKLAAPSMTSSSLEVSAAPIAPSLLSSDGTLNLVALSTFPSSYSTDSTQFTIAFDVNQNYIGQVLNDPGPSGPVKSMYVLLGQAQSAVDKINSQYSDSSGSPSNCTSLASSQTITTPFFSTAATTPMATWTDAGKYTCYVANADNGPAGMIVFGRQPIASPPTGCADAFEYYVIQSYGSQGQPNTTDPSRGTTVDISSVQKFYFDGCTSDLKLAYAQSTKYSAGVEFSSRMELTGNTVAHSFKIRTNYVDVGTSFANHITIAGEGVSRKVASSDSDVNFVMGYRNDNCGNATNSTSCTSGTAYSFCAKNSSTSNSYAQDATTADCGSYTTDFSAIASLDRSDLPTGYFNISASAYGL